MKRLLVPLLILNLAVSVISCSSMNRAIDKNKKSTSKLAKSLVQKNGNVFYLNSTYSTISTIWSYNGEEIEIYKLRRGKIEKNSTSARKSFISLSIPDSRDMENYINKCGFELDGDVFGFEIRNNSATEKRELFSEIKCLMVNKYDSEFLNEVVKDINNYILWDVKYE